MRRLSGPGLGVLLVGWLAFPASAQRLPEPPPAIVLEQPRANPIFPASLVPFTVGPDMCRKNHQPRVTMRVLNVFTQLVATLTLHERRSVVLDSIPMKCGQYLAQWDGTIDKGARVASPGVYIVQLIVDERNLATKLVFTTP
jgi:hypothetical protein